MILISTGHNPTKKGAAFEGTSEYEEATLWTARILSILAVELPKDDIKYVPTGSLSKKVDFINEQSDVDCVIELHFNSEPSHTARGSEVLYNQGSIKGKRLADCIMDEFKSREIFAPYRGSKEGIHHTGKPLYFLQKTKPVAVIIEPEFLFNIDTITGNFENGCQSIAAGIKKFIGKECPKAPIESDLIEFTESDEVTSTHQGLIKRLFSRWC